MSTRSKFFPLSSVLVCLVLIFTGCLPGATEQEPTAQVIIDLAYTQAAQTIIAELTKSAPSEITETPTLEPAEEHLPATSTPKPTLKPTNTSLPTASAKPTKKPTKIPTATKILGPNFVIAFADNFSSPSGWTIAQEENYGLRYSNGGYLIYNGIVNDDIWSTRGGPFDDTRVDVNASKMEGPRDGYYGVVCRFANGGNYYLFAISPNGWYGIAKKVKGMHTYLDEGHDDGNIIRPGKTPNLIRADCVGNKLRLYANDELLLQAKDDTFTSGSIGMAAGTISEPGFIALFDDFTLYVPEE